MCIGSVAHCFVHELNIYIILGTRGAQAHGKTIRALGVSFIAQQDLLSPVQEDGRTCDIGKPAYSRETRTNFREAKSTDRRCVPGRKTGGNLI